MSERRGPLRCNQCNEPIQVWRNANRDGRIRVDASPDDNGTVLKLVTRDPDREGVSIVWGKKLTGADLAAAIANNELLFTLHSVTCRVATKTRNPKPAGVEIDWSAAKSKQ